MVNPFGVEDVSKSTFSTAWSLGRSQRALRNSTRKEAWGTTRSAIKDMRANRGDAGKIEEIRDAGQKKLDVMGADFIRGRESLRGEQRNLTKPKRVVSNISQYPLRWGTGGALTVGGAEGGRRKFAKSAFGVEHVSKAKKKDVRKDPAYRESIFYPINPRSETYVRRGADSTVRRVGGPMVGGVVGGATGAAIGGGTAASPILGTAGAIGGASLMHTRNVRSGDTVGINRKTGKKAKSKVGFMDASVYNY